MTVNKHTMNVCTQMTVKNYNNWKHNNYNEGVHTNVSQKIKMKVCTEMSQKLQ